MDTRELIEAMYREFFNGHDTSAALKYVAENYIQHNPGVAQGRAALVDAFSKKFQDDPDFYLEIQQLIVDGDLAAVYLKNKGVDGRTKCRVVDIYRIENGRLAEHWDVLQPVE